MVFQRKPSGCTNQKELNNCIHFRFSEQILAAHSFSQLNYIFRIVDGENVSIQRILVHKIHVISLEFQSFVLCENLLFITFYLEQQDNNNYFFVIRHRNEEWKINKNTNISIHFISAVFFSLIVGTISATFNFNAEIDKKKHFSNFIQNNLQYQSTHIPNAANTQKQICDTKTKKEQQNVTRK